MCFAPQRRASQLPKVVRDRQFLTLLTSKCASRHNACTFLTSQLPKVVRRWCVLYILTWKCASRHNGGHFFDIATSKSGPTLCVLYILTWKCASRHNGVHFSTSQLPKVVRTPQFFTHFTSKCASRHNGVQFFISHLASCSAPAALASLLFDPPSPQIIGKTQCFATFLPFAHLYLLSSYSFSSDLLSANLPLSLPLPCSAFHLSILSEV